MIFLPFIAPFVRNKFVNRMPHESFACENMPCHSRRVLCSIALHMLRTLTQSLRSGYSTYESAEERDYPKSLASVFIPP